MWLHAGEFQPRLQGCAVRAIPTFPRYRLAKPPVAKRWLGGGAALVLLSGIIAAMAGKSGANTSIILFCMVGMVLLGGVVWFVRTIFFAFQFIIHIPGSAKQKMSAGIGGKSIGVSLP